MCGGGFLVTTKGDPLEATLVVEMWGLVFVSGRFRLVVVATGIELEESKVPALG